MKLEACYYIANRTVDGLLKIAHEEIGPYYDTDVLISANGYNTREAALTAVEGYIKAYNGRYGWFPSYTFVVLEELTAFEDGE
jgi:hypothetical protein